jgi:hypothetical protein
MQNILTAGRHLIPVEQIVSIETFDPAQNPGVNSDRPYRSRVVLIDRNTHLSEETLEVLAEKVGFRFLAQDKTAFNPHLTYRVETFVTTPTFIPERPFKTRLKWRDADGEEQSKLLLTSPEIVISILMRAEAQSLSGAQPPKRTSGRKMLKLQNARN